MRPADDPPSAQPPGPWPAVSGLDLDDLVDELRARAKAARAAHEQLTRLLDAVVAVSSDLELSEVLTRIVASACSLVGARYGALGVLHPDGEYLAEFITHGVSPEDRAAVGDPPHGRGVLGLLIRDPRPRRMRDIGSDPASYGFPPNHPPMHSFLGTPIRTRESVFGNLYLSEKLDADEFTAEDEAIVVALAAAAGVAIENARLFAAGARRASSNEALSELAHAILEGEDEELALRLVTEHTVASPGVTFAAIALTQESGDLVVEQAVPAGDVVGTTLHAPSWDSVRLGRAPVLFARPGTDAVAPGLLAEIERLAELAEGAPAGSVTGCPGAAIPLTTGGDDLGVLVVLWDGTTGAEPMSAMSELTTFVQHAGLALLAGRSRRDRAQVALLDERQRIARDMHDHVIQRLFATGLSLQAAAQPGPANARIEEAVDELDAVIREIRMTIFELQTPDPEGQRAQLEQLVAGFARGFGSRPALELTGEPEAVPADAWSDLLAVVREGLSNALRHSRATTVSVCVQVPPAAGPLVVEVHDDGRGVAPGAARSGLVNLDERATGRGGSFRILAGDPGTILRWEVPLLDTTHTPTPKETP